MLLKVTRSTKFKSGEIGLPHYGFFMVSQIKTLDKNTLQYGNMLILLPSITVNHVMFMYPCLERNKKFHF
jgi:hypothetical protein